MILESLLILVFNAIWGVVYKRAKRSLDNSKIMKQILVIAFTLTIAFLEVQIFVHFQTQNYYQIFELKRDFSQNELKNAHKRIIKLYHPDKNPDIPITQFYKMKQINNVLSNDEMRQVYDCYGQLPADIKSNQFENSVIKFKNQHLISFILFYLITIMMLLVQTFHRELRDIRIKASIVICIFAYNEWRQVEDSRCPLLLGVALPTLTLYELIRVQRIVMTTLLVGLVFYQRCLTRGMEWTLNALELCRIEMNRSEDGVVSSLNEVLSNLLRMSRDQERQIEQSKSKRQRFMNFLVMCLMFVFVGTQAFQEFNMRYGFK